jgi:hypothetical protein
MLQLIHHSGHQDLVVGYQVQRGDVTVRHSVRMDLDQLLHLEPTHRVAFQMVLVQWIERIQAQAKHDPSASATQASKHKRSAIEARAQRRQ